MVGWGVVGPLGSRGGEVGGPGGLWGCGVGSPGVGTP